MIATAIRLIIQKYWYTATTQNGNRVTLYVETYDAAIEHDLQQAPAGSLIQINITKFPQTIASLFLIGKKNINKRRR